MASLLHAHCERTTPRRVEAWEEGSHGIDAAEAGPRRRRDHQSEDHRLLDRPTGGLNAELLCVLGVQSLPATELHGLGADDASNRLTREEPLKDVEADVPARGAPRDEAALDVVPEREARAAAERLELPPAVATTPGVLEQPRRLGPLYGGLGDLRCRRPDRRELHRPHGGQVPIGV